jgi:membrane peptidoglycan carboxypeptidase
MQARPATLHVRRARRRPSRRSHFGQIGLLAGLLASLLAAVGGIALALAYSSLTRDLPQVDLLPVLLDTRSGRLLKPTRFYDRSGETVLAALENPAAGSRRFLAYDEFPPSLIAATIASADPGFWRHPGFTLAGIRDGSHPTLAQRLVSELLLWEEPPSLRRALRERLLAAQATFRYGRRQVLAWYLNSADYGRLAYGAEAAAQVYFGKPARELSRSEAALLAGVARAPALNPHDAPEAALENGDLVLQAMLAQGSITPDQVRLELPYIREPLGPLPNPAPVFISITLQELERAYPLARLYRGALEVTTTLDLDLQAQATCTATFQLARLFRADGTSGPPADCPAGRLLPGLASVPTGPLDGLEAEAVVLDPLEGEVLALAAARLDENEAGKPAPVGSLAVLGLEPLDSHPAGTLITPFIYFTAFTRGWNPASLAWDIPPEEEAAIPENWTAYLDSHDFQGPVRLRTALANDLIAPAIQVFQQAGPENVSRDARQFGLTFLDPTARGEAAWPFDTVLTLPQAALAYGVFAREGELAGGETDPAGLGSVSSSQEAGLLPVTVLEVEDTAGQAPWPGLPVGRRAITNPQLAYLVNQILSDETARWPSLGRRNPLELDRPAAAKLGQTADRRGVWALGYTPQLVLGAWVGYAQPAAVTGFLPPVPVESAAALWHALARYGTAELPPEGWRPPAGINAVEVCDPSGLLPTNACPATVREIFLAGSEPTLVDSLYRRIQINRETGRLATVFTPPELIEARVYLNPPPQAAAWAQAAGLPVPPDIYDVNFGAQSTSPEAQFASPAMFAVVRGQVEVRGTAAGEGFKSFRLQAGQGLNPEAWIQIGPETSERVQAGLLGVWDTRGFDGLYALQLLVVRQEDRVDTAVIQVTVDNELPEVEIHYPAEGQVFSASEWDLVTFQAEAVDNLGITGVEFLVDGVSLATLAEGPYAFPWPTELGPHTLTVIAADRAGNTSEAQALFRVIE